MINLAWMLGIFFFEKNGVIIQRLSEDWLNRRLEFRNQRRKSYEEKWLRFIYSPAIQCSLVYLYCHLNIIGSWINKQTNKQTKIEAWKVANRSNGFGDTAGRAVFESWPNSCRPSIIPDLLCKLETHNYIYCLLYTSPSPRD